MIESLVNKENFCFTYLQDYAGYLLDNKLVEFVTVNIRFCREANLPLLKPLAKFSEAELVGISTESNRLLLEALRSDTIAAHIEMNSQNWINNRLGIVDKDEISAEDLTLAFYLRRKIFAFFLDAYTKNVVLQKFIIAEIDQYTTQEELISYNIYLKMQQEKMININNELNVHRELLIEAQELGGMGSFMINFSDQSKTVYTPEYKRILELDEITTFEKFLEWIHPDDREKLKSSVMLAFENGGKYEVEYRYNKSGKNKRIWSKGFVLSDKGRPTFIRGVVREMLQPDT